MSGSTPSNSYFGSSGVLPELLYHVWGSTPTKMVREGIGSTPIFTNLFLRPLLWEHSHKNGIALLGVLPKSKKLYIGSDLNMIYNLDILLPLDNLGVLAILLLLLSLSTPGRLIFSLWEYSQKAYFMSVGVLVIHDIILLESISKSSGNTPNTFIFAHWEYSQNAYFCSLGVLLKFVYNKHSHWPKISLLGVLPESKNESIGSNILGLSWVIYQDYISH